jgi:hypothetical protein
MYSLLQSLQITTLRAPSGGDPTGLRILYKRIIIKVITSIVKIDIFRYFGFVHNNCTGLLIFSFP